MSLCIVSMQEREYIYPNYFLQYVSCIAWYCILYINYILIYSTHFLLHGFEPCLVYKRVHNCLLFSLGDNM